LVLITIGVLLLLTPLLVVNCVFLLEVGAGLLPLRRRLTAGQLGGATIIIPAHNEAAVIGRTLDGLLEHASSPFRILVVADNCTDDTAAIARSRGASVIERVDPDRRGKGFALAFARDHLTSVSIDPVIVLDADCRTDAESLRQLAAICRETASPVQAINLLEPSLDAPAMVQLSAFAFLVKNKIRQQGLQRLTGSVHLTGTGMCLPWAAFDQADLATASIVEDIRLGLELSQRGAHTLLVEHSSVWSPHAEANTTLTQRSRWEGGYLALARRTAPGLLLDGLRQVSLTKIVKALDLTIPPLALLTLYNVAALALFTTFAVTSFTGWTPTLLLASVNAMNALALLIVWWREGRAFLTPGALLRIPLYALWKVPMYLGLIRKGAPSDWVRTERPD
jgi:cellulose synthase/poly-beta-1,6-N-acetylglucosamine synthase-like glycosyltransferase